MSSDLVQDSFLFSLGAGGVIVVGGLVHSDLLLELRLELHLDLLIDVGRKLKQLLGANIITLRLVESTVSSFPI